MFENFPEFIYGRYVLLAIIVVFALFAISRSYLRLRHGNETIFEFIMWTCLWTLVIVIVIVPDITGIPAKILGIGRGIDVLVYFGIVFLLYSTFRVYSKIERLEQEITSLTRATAFATKKFHGEKKPSKKNNKNQEKD